MSAVVNYFRSHQTWLRDNYSRTANGVRLDVTDEEKDAYATVCAMLLKREIKNGKFTKGYLKDIKDFDIPFNSLCASYTNPQTGNTEYIDLISIEDEQIKTALKAYYKESGAKIVGIAAHSKGNLNGPDPLDTKNDSALKKLIQSHTFSHIFDKLLPELLARNPDPQSRMVVTRRLLFVEFYHKKMTESLEAAIKARTDALANVGGNKKALQSLNDEIKHLKGLQDKLKNLDLYALCKVLIHYPIDPSTDKIDELVQFLEKSVGRDIIKGNWFIRNLSETQIAYGKDVAGMARLHRKPYFDFCKEKNIPQKNEGIGDLFLREALKYETNIPPNEYEAEGFKKSIFIDGFPESLKAELKVNLGTFGVLATHGIGFRINDEYETPATPANATDTEKAQKAKTDAALLKGHIAAHRSRVELNPNLPPPVDNGIVAAPVVGPVSGLAAASAAVVIGTQLAPVVAPYIAPIIEIGNRAIQVITNNIPQVVVDGFRVAQEMAPAMPEVVVDASRNALAVVPWVSQGVVSGFKAIQNHPVTVIAGVTLADKAFQYTYPLVRGPDGSIRREFQPLRAATITAAGAAGALALYNAPQATLQSIVTTTGALKDWIFLPANVAVKFVAGLVVIEQLSKRVKKDIQERNWANLTALTTLGTLAAMMYYAANDGVVDNGVLEMAGNWMGSILTSVAGTAYSVYNYNKATQIASMVGVSGLLAWKEGKDQKEAAQQIMTSVAMGMPINQIITAGKGVVDRELPPKLATIISIPADVASGFAGNMGMVKNGEILGGMVVGISGLAGRLFGSIKDAYTTLRQTNPAPLVLL